MKRVATLALLALAVSVGAGEKFEVSRTREALSIKSPAGTEILRYQLTRPSDTKLSVESACYFHPVTTPKGIVMTEVAPSDHLHHRGIFLAWVEMHGKQDADFWGWGEHAPKKGRTIVNRAIADIVSGADGAAFGADNDWLAETNLVISERLRAKARIEGPATIVDLSYTLTPTHDVTLSRWAFSGFCVRVRKDGKLEAHGPDGVVKLPDPKHTEPASDWPAAPWYGYTLTLPDGTVAGAAVVNHPKNPPTLWHNHRQVRMLNPCIVAPDAVQLKAKVPLMLRYRVVVHDGATPRELLGRLAGNWD